MYGRDAYLLIATKLDNESCILDPLKSKAHFRDKLNFGYPRGQIFDFTCPASPDNFFVDCPAF